MIPNTALRKITMFRDPTPNGYINQRYLFTMVKIGKESTELSLQEFDNFVEELAFVVWKMSATWRHVDAYIKLEDTLIESEKLRLPFEQRNSQNFEYSQDLFFELDGFLVQMKSTLDYLAKLPSAIIGKNFWPNNINFRNKGKNVVEILQSNMLDKWRDEAKQIEDIINKHQPWLQMAITARDMINHRAKGGFDIDSSVVVKTTINSKEKILVPMWQENKTVRKFMDIVWHNLMVLVEQFTIGFLAMRLKSGLSFEYNKKPIGSIESPIRIIKS
jgi:hypothetical protein